MSGKLQKNKKSTVINNTVDFATQEKTSWETLENFHDRTANEENFVSRYGASFAEYDKMDIYQLRDEMVNDDGSKSVSFKKMRDAVDRLLKLSSTDGKETLKNGKEKTRVFYDIMIDAQMRTQEYILLRGSKKFHIYESGKRRLDIAERVFKLLGDIVDENNRKFFNMSEKNRRMAEYALQGLSDEEIEKREALLKVDKKTGESLDIMKVIESGQFGPQLSEEEAKKLEKTWLIKGYSKELMKYLEDPKKYDSKDKINEFLAILQDKNNLLLANKMTINKLVDFDKDITRGYPWLKNELKSYIDENLNRDDMLDKKPEEIARITRDLMKSYGEENRARIEGMKEREEKVTSLLEMSQNTDETLRLLYKYPQMETLLLNSTDEEFNARFEEVKSKVEGDSLLIKEELGRRFCIGSRDVIYKRLNSLLAGRRLFASSDELMASVADECDMLRFSMPDIYMAEKKLDSLMSSNNITSEVRDRLVMHVTKGAPGDFLKLIDRKSFTDETEKYGKRFKANRSLFNKEVVGYFGLEKYGFRFTRDIWERLDEINLKAGDLKKEDFQNEIKKVTDEGRTKNGERITLKEYQSRRQFESEEEEKDRLKRAKVESDRINELGESIHKTFLLRIAKRGRSDLDHYKNTDSIYRGSKGDEASLEQKRNKDYEEVIKRRTGEFHEALQRAGISKNRWKTFDKSFEWMIVGLNETGANLHKDERLKGIRENLEQFGVQDWSEAISRLDQLLPDMVNRQEPEEIKKARQLYDKGLKSIEDFKDGKYKAIADIIADRSDVRSAMMSDDPRVLEDYLKNRIDPMFSGLADSFQSFKQDAYYANATYRQYVYSNRELFFSGVLKGDSDFFLKELQGFNRKLFSGIIEKNVNKVSGNLLREYRKLNGRPAEGDKKDKKKKTVRMRADENAVILAALGKVVYTGEDTSEHFEDLLNAGKMEKLALEELKNNVKVKEADFKNIKAESYSITKAADGWMMVELPSVKDQRKNNRHKDIWKEKREGKNKRRSFLNVDYKEIDRVRAAKSLFRFGDKRPKIDYGKDYLEYTDDREFVSGSKKDVEAVRGFIMQNIDFTLPGLLMDALVEEGASYYGSEKRALRKDRSGSGAELILHARSMFKYYNILTRDSAKSSAMSDEEAELFLLTALTDRQYRGIFYSGGDADMDLIRESSFYKGFRENYKKLRDMEKEDTGDDPSLEKEKKEFSRNMRIILITRMGLNIEGKDKKISINRINEETSKTIERHHKYIKYSSMLSALIRERVESFRSDPKNSVSDFYKDREVMALREYFMSSLIDVLNAGEEFDAGAFREKIREFYDDKDKREEIMLARKAYSDEDIARAEDKRIGYNRNGAKDLADVIRKSQMVFHGRENKYEKLDKDQKRFFALALVLMDKGAIGYGSEGTTAALYSKESKQKELEEIGRQINNYIEGREYHINVDYREAVNKLMDFGNTMTQDEVYTLSETAFNTALNFARSLYTKKMAYEGKEVDMDRISDGRSSIEAAFETYGKKQKNELDKINSTRLDEEDVKKLLLKQCGHDMVSKKNALVGGGIAALSVAAFGGAFLLANADKKRLEEKKAQKAAELGKKKEDIKPEDLDWDVEDAQITGMATGGVLGLAGGMKIADKSLTGYKRMRRLSRRIEALSGADLKLFLRIMQDRTLLDKSTTGSGKFVKQEERDALFEALTGDEQIQSETMKDFDDNESCHKAITNALSFQLRDDRFFKGKAITHGHFESSSLGRNTLVDWSLIERALDFFDSIKECRLERRVAENAKDYIKESGNDKAIKIHEKLEKKYGSDKSKFDRSRFEKEMAAFAASDNSEVKLSNSIERTWSGYMALTDKEKALFFKVLGKRDLLDISKKNYKRSFFGLKERNFMNASGRDKLIDEYIELSKGDGIGIQLDENAYYEGMRSLLSTQVSDRVNLRNVKDLKKIFSYERNFFGRRKTAIDWKLFERALNFVHRANKELRMQEGNELLYQGCGDLLRHGRIRMDYSFLRRNFHKTGNQWFRYAGRRTVQNVDEKFGPTIKSVLGIADAVRTVTNIIKVDRNGTIGKGIDWIASKKNEYAEAVKTVKDNRVEKIGVRTKDEQKLHDMSEEERKAQNEKKKSDIEATRKELLLYDRLNEGLKSIVTSKKDVNKAFGEMIKFLKDNVDLNVMGDIPSSEIKLDEKNLVNKMTKGMASDKSRGDVLDGAINAINKAKKIEKTTKDVYKAVGQVPLVKNLTSMITYYGENLIWRSVLEDGILKLDMNTYDENHNIIKTGDMLTNDEFMKKMKQNMSRFTEEKIGDVFEAVFGKDVRKDILNMEDVVYQVQQSLSLHINQYMKYFNHAKKCVQHVENIASGFRNINMLDSGEKKAADREEEDRKKLEKASEKRLDATQAKKAESAMISNNDTVGMGKAITKTMQGMNIASETINMAIETANQFGKKFDFGQEMISKAIREGMEFVLFAARIFTDRQALKDYLISTESGREEVNKIISGFEKSAALHEELKRSNNISYSNKAGKTAEDLKKAVSKGKDSSFVSDLDLVDIVSDAKGYEHTSELVEDTGMQIAQSLVFCASVYNPMSQSKLMAITVMTVLGISRKDIGKASPEIVQKVFNGLKMAR